MKCESCGVEMVVRQATDDAPYAYTLSGLKDVFLTGVLVRKCPKCAEESAVIPRIEELHNVITEAVIKKPTSLNGEEIRFLRKHARFPAKEFAALLRIDAAHLSRIENGHTPALGPQADTLARAIVLAATKCGDMALEVLLQVAKRLDQKPKSKKAIRVAGRPVFALDREGWREAA